MSDAFYLPTDDPARFIATLHTQGPWNPELQHAGPPCALLARTIERVTPSIDGPVQLTRLTVEILGGVPVAEVAVRAQVARPGRSVELVEAELQAGGRPVLRARAWRIRSIDVDLPAEARVDQPVAPPLPERETDFLPELPPFGYQRAIEWRFVEKQSEIPGLVTAWARPKVPLVAGERIGAVQRQLLLADSGNGLSMLLDPHRWWFINTELTVHLYRPPTGEWVGLAARTTLGGQGAGLAESTLFDMAGAVGRAAQALLVGPRP